MEGPAENAPEDARLNPRQPLWSGLLVLATLLAGIGAIAVTDATQSTAVWWPAGGLAILAVMVSPRHWWPTLFAALALAYFLANLLMGRSFAAALGLGLADIAETMLVGHLVLRWVGRRLDRVQDLGWLFLASGAGAALAGMGVAITSATLLGGDFFRTVATTTTAHTASLLVVLPLVMTRRHPGRLPRIELAGQTTLLAIMVLVVFGPTEPDLLSLTFAPLPLIVWAAVSFGPRVVAIQQLLIALVATAMTLIDWGPLARVEGILGSQVIQLYVISLLATGLPLALAARQHTDALARLQEERDYTAAVMNTTPSYIAVIAGDGHVLLANPALCEATGYDEQTLVGSPYWAHAIPATQRAAVRAAFLARGLRLNGEQVLSTADGRRLQVLFSTHALEAGTVGAARYVLTGDDVTEKRLGARLMSHLLESGTTVGFVLTDLDGVVTLLNSGSLQMLDRTSEQVVGRPFVDLLAPTPEAPPFDEVVGRVRDTGTPETRDWAWRDESGGRVLVSMTTSRVDDNLGHPIGYLFVARDVTDTRRSQEILVQALEREREAVVRLQALDAARDDLISTVSHELRTPMTSILGSAELLADGTLGSLDDGQLELVEVIARNGDRLLSLANDLLALAEHDGHRAEGGHRRVALDLRDVVVESRHSVQGLLHGRTLSVTTDLPESAVAVLGDLQQLERAVTNLLSNAIKFTPDGGRISIGVTLHPDAEHAVLTVSDTGLGIPAEEAERVFDRFFRSGRVQDLAIQGTGLGLSIVKQVVEAHLGWIDLTSGEGAGTTFRVTLPLAQ